MQASLLAVLFALGAPPPASWVVMPVWAEHPPPQDPTLLRLSTRLARAVEVAVDGPVRLASREERDRWCRDDGHRCPMEVAALIEADRVIALTLEGNERVAVSVFAGRAGAIASGAVPCAWSAGRLACDAEALERLVRDLAPKPLDREALFDAFLALGPELEACAASDKTKPGATVTLRVRPDGRATHVRVAPKALARREAYRCMARAVEGLEVAPFAGAEAGPFRFALPEVAP